MPRAVSHHRRFALTEVTFDGDPVGGATVDVWLNAAGAECWAARVLMVPREGSVEGVLSGKARDGRRLQGRVAISGQEPGLAPRPAPRARSAVLVEWHGLSRLQAEPAPEG